MATGVGMGFDLDALDKAIVKADNNLRKLAQDAEVQSKRISDAFSIGATKGISQFVKEIANARGGISKLMAEGAEFKFTANGAKGFSAKVIDEINKVINYSRKEFENLNATITRSMLIKPTLDVNSIKELENRLVILNQGLATGMLGQGKGKKKIAVDDDLRVRINDEIKAINERLSLLRMSTAQFNQMKAQEATAIINNVKLEQEAIEAGKRRAQEAIQNYKRELDAARNAYRERKQMYEQLFKEQEKQMSQNRRASYKLDVVGGTGMNAADNALRYAGRIYSDRGLRSVNNMQKAIQRMQQAQQRLNLNTEQGRQKYEQLDKEIKRVKGDIDRVTDASENLKESHSKLLDTSGQLARALAAVFSVSAIKGYVNKLMQIRGEFELQQRSLQVLLQNKDEANALWDKTVALAVKSPYTTKQLVTATKQLAAYRVESEKLYETNKMLADVSIGLGVDMNRLILAFGQVKAANFLRGTELRQFSEAGVNMLDELAKRFTALEGRAVSVGEVFERVSKRMVSFKDVEAVFKTITSEGGMFYQMQEKQSETLKGMMLNLKDSYELMLNDIGKSNEGMLKGFVSMMKTLVDNWQVLSEVLKGVGAALVLYKLSIASTNRDLIAMALQMGVVNKTGTKQLTILNLLTLGFKKLTKGVKGAGSAMKAFMASNAITLTITAIIYALYKLYHAFSKHQEQLEEITKKYSDLRKEVATINVKFTYAENKNELKESLNKLADFAKQNSISVDVNLEGLEEEQLKEKFNNLNNQILNTLAFAESFSKAISNSDSWWQLTDGIIEDFEQFSASAQTLSTTLRNEIDNLVDYLAKTGKLTDEMKDAFKPRNIAGGETELDYIERVSKAYEKYLKTVRATTEETKKGGHTVVAINYNRLVKLWGKDLYDSIIKTRNAIDDFNAKQKEATDEFIQFKDELKIPALLNDESRTVYIKAAIDQKAFDDFTRDMWYRLANEHFAVNITPSVPEKKEVTGWVKEYNKFVGTLKQGVDKEGNTLAIVKPMQADTDPTEYLNKLKGTYERLQKDIEAWDAGNAKARAQYTEDEINAIKAQNAERKKAIDWQEYDKKKNKKEESEELKRLKKQIQLVRQLADDYEEMWKKYGKAHADANIKSEARRNAFAEFELDIDDFVVGTRQDEKNNLGKLLEKALGIEGGKVEVEKAVADVEVEVRWDLQEQANANLSREFENLFGNYELSLELEKLNIPPDLANQLFGIDSIDLTTLRKEVLNKVGLGDMVGKTNNEILNSNAYKKLNEHQRKELAAHLQKVSQMEQKEQEERLKKYIAFSSKAMSERAKIKFEELQTIAEIEKAFAIKEGDSEDVKATKRDEEAKAKAKAKKDANDALQKLDWEDFKSSDTFNSIFDDLENASDEVLKKVINRLKDFKAQWKDMPFDQMRQVVDLLQKAEEALKESDNPFTEAKRLKKAIKEDGRSKEQAQLDVYNAEQQKAINEQALADYDLFEKVANKQIAATTLTTEQLKEYVEWQSKSTDAQRMLVEGKKKENTELDKSIQKGNNQLNNIKKLTDVYKEQEDSINQINKLTQDLYGSFMDLAENGAALFGKELDDTTKIFADMGASMADTVMQTVALYINLKSVETGAYAAGTALNTAMGVIGWIVMGVQLLSQAFKAIVDAHDNGLQKQIDAEAKSVERLQKAYEDLEEQIKNTYDISELNSTTKAAQDNLLAQISATERMIDAEEDKKKSDQDAIDGYKDEIDNLKKQYKELEETRLQELGAFATDENKKSGAEAFLDAWMEAYKQTGDGLSGLNEQFDEFFEDSVKRQMLQKATSKYLENLFNKYDSEISDWAKGDLTDEELMEKLSGLKDDLPALNENLKKWAEATGIAAEFAGKDADLSGLQAGIQSVSEETADVLASYMSNVSLYVADNNLKITQITDSLLNGSFANPIVNELKTLINQNNTLYDLLSSLTTPHPTLNGMGFKVVM